MTVTLKAMKGTEIEKDGVFLSGEHMHFVLVEGDVGTLLTIPNAFTWSLLTQGSHCMLGPRGDLLKEILEDPMPEGNLCNHAFSEQSLFSLRGNHI